MATLKDVAREAGLSVGTVSRVLNNRGYISEETRQSVSQAMKKLNYQPNEMARALSRSRSSMIGVIVPSISEEYVRACCSNKVAGLVLCSGQVRTAMLRDLGFPVVTYERFLNDADAGVECDNYQGGRLAAEALLNAGCRNLISISGAGQVSMPADARRDGFLDTCGRCAGVRARDFVCSPERIGDLDYIPELYAFLDEVPDVDGVFASSDVIAAQMIRALRERGKSVPEDVRIVGYDDVLISELTDPQLTTIHQPVREMADACIDIIKRAADGEEYPSRTTFPVTLVRRGTV